MNQRVSILFLFHSEDLFAQETLTSHQGEVAKGLNDHCSAVCETAQQATPWL